MTPTPYIDMHCDTLMQAFLRRRKDLLSLPGMVDLTRLKQGGCRAQFFAIFMPPIRLKRWIGPLFPKDEAYIRSCVSIFEHAATLHPDLLAPARSFADLQKNTADGKISGILTLEDGRAVNGSLDNLDRFYQMGIRLISLTWNAPNCFGAPNGSTDGLTEFGHRAVLHMNRLGMLVDVSHLSDRGFYEVAELCRAADSSSEQTSASAPVPFVASHSNCRALNPHPRSMTDDMIRTLASCGGVMGVNFGPQFLTADLHTKKSQVTDIVAQLRHMTEIGGIGCAAIGTDFDGISGKLEIGSADRMPMLFDALCRAGFTDTEIEQIAYKNVERVFRYAESQSQVQNRSAAKAHLQSS